MAVHAPTRIRCSRHSLHLNFGDFVLYRGQWLAIQDFTQDGLPAVFSQGLLTVLSISEITAWRQAASGSLN